MINQSSIYMVYIQEATTIFTYSYSINRYYAALKLSLSILALISIIDKINYSIYG